MMLAVELLGFCFVALYILWIFIKDNSKVDIFWGLGFVLLTWGIVVSNTILSISHYVLIGLVTAWGLRLAYVIGQKHLQHPWEDFRYAQWRKNWEFFYIRSLFQIYFLQFILMCLVAIPILLMYWNIGYQNMIVLFIWTAIALFGLGYETIADKQLSDFKKTKKKWDILTSWLRKYHRYPQYFWESAFWLGIATIASQVSPLAFIGWIIITILVRFVSWVPMLEKRYTWDKKYEKYSKKTNIFFPDWLKK